jgi:fatty-acyl-CoA synthase
MNPARWVERWAGLEPSRPALVWAGGTLSYAGLHRRTAQVARWLRAQGVGEGDRVAVLLRNGPEILEVFLACARLGAIFLPLNFRSAPGELAFFLEDADPLLLVAGGEFSSALGAHVGEGGGAGGGHSRPVYWVGRPPARGRGYKEATRADPAEPDVREPWGRVDCEAPHVLMYTSGTTGRPKGTLLPYRKTFFNCLGARDFFDLRPGDVMLVALPLFHSGGLLIQACPSLYRGATLVLHRRFDPERLYQDLERYRVTQFLGVPTVYRALLGVAARGRTASLRAAGIGGESATPELVTACLEAGFPLRGLMGQTETSIFLWASPEDLARKPGTVGRPVFHAEVRLVDGEGLPVAPGEVGELQVRGPIAMAGYWRNPEETGRVFQDGWLRTGDLARVDGDGCFYLADRLRDMYISGGENVYPAEVEQVLRELPAVAEVAVVGVADPRWGEVGHAFVVPRAGDQLRAEDVIAHCEGRLARYKWPRDVSFVEELPKTALGKVRKGDLAARATGGGGGDAAASPNRPHGRQA